MLDSRGGTVHVAALADGILPMVAGQKQTAAASDDD